MEIYVKNIFYFYISFSFWFSNMILSEALILSYRSFKRSK